MASQEDILRASLSRTGQDEVLADAMLRVDAVAQSWRRQMHKRELGNRATRALDLDLDLAQVDVLFAISSAPVSLENNEDGETMVSTVAERLHIDPSRASRVVSELVNAGYVRRAASQRDARRTILELTPAGQAVIDGVHAFKWLLLGEFFSGWSREDLAAFVPLLERYSSWIRTSEGTEEKFADEIADIARMIKTARASLPSGRKSG